MKLHLQIFAVLLTIHFSSPAYSQRIGEASGYGISECGEYLNQRQQDKQSFDAIQTRMYSSWVQGYLAAYNLTSSLPRISNTPDRTSIIAYLDKHCRERPLDNLLRGVNCLIADSDGYRPDYCKK